MHSSSEMVEKICRSSIGETIAADLRLLARLTTLAETELLQLRPYRLQPMVCESARSL
jgi:predicted unusual protein kinase regulating ubiquinone biosynthesis (AarF/ABC1/UbiB family)